MCSIGGAPRAGRCDPRWAMGEYTALAVAAALAALALELGVLRTGLLRTVRYWISMAIVLGFQAPVDGWLTKSEQTVVHYDAAYTLGVRFPWNIPVEDFGFGFALVTITLSLWRWWLCRAPGSGPTRVTDPAVRPVQQSNTDQQISFRSR